MSSMDRIGNSLKLVPLVVFLACPLYASASNYATCLLDKLPGLENDNAAYAAVQVCTGNYPKRFDPIPQGSGRGFFGYDSGAECALDKSGDTRSQTASYQIRVACNRLYDEPGDLFDEFGIRQ